MRPTPGVKLTYDDFLLFPDDGKRHELIDGEHYVTPSPNTAHQRIVGRLHLALGRYLETHPVGEDHPSDARGIGAQGEANTDLL